MSKIEGYKKVQDAQEKSEFIQQWLPYVRWVADRFVTFLPDCLDMEDAVSQGVLGLIRATNTFDKSKGVDFKTYAFYRIKGAILDELRKLDWRPRSVEKKAKLLENAYSQLEGELGRMPEEDEVARHLGLGKKEFYKLLKKARSPQLLSLDAHFRDTEDTSILSTIKTEEKDILTEMEEEELKEKLKTIINDLRERERLFIMLYYYEEMTLKEIGKVMALSESSLSQLHLQIIIHLKAVIKKII